MPRNQSENTQGAPTEGLGQTVTFAPKIGGSAPQAQGVDFGRSGGSGLKTVGSGTSTPDAMMIPPAPPNKTIALLAQVASDVTKADIEKMKVEKFVGGMQRAMHGEAVSDIAADQPWYATLFGEADAVEGARSYAASAKASSIAMQMEESMHKLREMGPTEAQAYFTKTVTENLTGDKATDGAILQAMTRTLPSVMKAQAKMHYAYQQERAVAADAGQFEAGAALVQIQGSRQVDGEQDMLTRQANEDRFFYDQVPPQGVDPENWQAGKTKQMLLALQRGQLHAINALTRPGKNILEALKPEQAAAIEAARHAAENRLITKYSFEYADDHAEIMMLAKDLPIGGDARSIGVKVDALNNKFRNETGAVAGLISPTERARLMSEGYSGILAEKKAQLHRDEAAAKTARTAAEKVAAEAAKLQGMQRAVLDGTVGTLIGTTKEITKEYADGIVSSMYGTMQPEQRPVFLSRLYSDKYIATPVANALDGAVNNAIIASGDAYTGELINAAAGWKKLHDINPEAAAAYYPKHGATFLLMDKLISEQAMTPQAAWKAARHPEPHGEISKSAMEFASKAVSYSLTPESSRLLSMHVAQRAKPYAASQGDEAAAKTAMKLSEARNEVEVIGKHAWKQYDTKQVRLSSALATESFPGQKDGIPVDHISDAFDAAVRFKLYGDKSTPGIVKSSKEIHIFRAKDVGGVQLFIVSTEDGQKVYMDSNDIRATYKRGMEKFAAPVTPDIPGA